MLRINSTGKTISGLRELNIDQIDQLDDLLNTACTSKNGRENDTRSCSSASSYKSTNPVAPHAFKKLNQVRCTPEFNHKKLPTRRRPPPVPLPLLDTTFHRNGRNLKTSQSQSPCTLGSSLDVNSVIMKLKQFCSTRAAEENRSSTTTTSSSANSIEDDGVDTEEDENSNANRCGMSSQHSSEGNSPINFRSVNHSSNTSRRASRRQSTTIITNTSTPTPISTPKIATTPPANNKNTSPATSSNNTSTATSNTVQINSWELLPSIVRRQSDSNIVTTTTTTSSKNSPRIKIHSLRLISNIND
jgi:hypothetical protein